MRAAVVFAYGCVVLGVSGWAPAALAAEPAGPATGEKAPAAAGVKTLYLCAIIQNEEDSVGDKPTGRADFDHQEQVLRFATGQYRAVGKLFHKYGAKINLQADWTFADGVKKFDPAFFADWEAMGHEVDTHAYDSHVPYADVKERLKAAGAHPTRCAGGTTEMRIPRVLPRFESTYPEFEVLWGAGSLGHVQPEENTRYVWRPARMGNWFSHDPKGKTIYVGGNCNPIRLDAVRQAAEKARPDRVNVYSIFLGSFEAPNLAECRGAAAFEEFLKGVQELAQTCDLKWKSLTEIGEIFKAREAEASLNFGDIHPGAVPRIMAELGPPPEAIEPTPEETAMRREADYNHDGVVDEVEKRLWRKGGPRPTLSPPPRP